MRKYKTRRKIHKKHKSKKNTKRKSFIKINHKKGGAAAEETFTEELYVANPFKKPEVDENNYVSLYKWDYPNSIFVQWNRDNVGKNVEFVPFGEPKMNNCHVGSYNKDKTECWVKWGPNSLFFTTKQDFENELKYRYAKLKKNNKNRPSIEKLREIKNSMLGYETDAVQNLVEIKTLKKNILAPCIDQRCEPCPDGITKAVDCEGAEHLGYIVKAQAGLPFSGVGYTIDLDNKGRNFLPYIGSPEFIIPQTNKVKVVPVSVYNGDEKLIEFYEDA